MAQSFRRNPAAYQCEHSTALGAETQQVFQKGFFTEQAILAIRIINRKPLDRSLPVDLIFVVENKAFDSVPHEALLNLIQQLGASNNVLRPIQQLHEEPKRTIQGTTQHSAIIVLSVTDD